jgi:hypothetical protein
MYQFVDSLCRATHVADLCHAERFVGQYAVGVFAVELVLCGAGEVDVGFLFPRLASFEEL